MLIIKAPKLRLKGSLNGLLHGLLSKFRRGALKNSELQQGSQAFRVFGLRLLISGFRGLGNFGV